VGVWEREADWLAGRMGGLDGLGFGVGGGGARRVGVESGRCNPNQFVLCLYNVLTLESRVKYQVQSSVCPYQCYHIQCSAMSMYYQNHGY